MFMRPYRLLPDFEVTNGAEDSDGREADYPNIYT